MEHSYKFQKCKLKLQSFSIFLFIFMLLSGTKSAQSQTAVIKGYVKDTINKTYPQYVVVSLLKSSDSTLVNFALSNEKGYFEIDHLPEGNMILLLTHVGYADYTEKVVLKAGGIVNMDTLFLTQKARLLQEVIIKAQAAVSMKGDTVEYLANKFAVQPNATVEDLLKRLPGITVDRKGEITAQGQKVEKILVDGEEFFGQDPTTTSQNLRADIVDKVQVFDKKSKQEELTGINDGNRSKTINLEIKKDKKHNFFGVLNAGIGTQNQYNNKGTLNIFDGTLLMAIYANMQNSAGTSASSTSWDATSNFSNSWNKGKVLLSGNYGVRHNKSISNGTTLSQQLLSDTVLNNFNSHNNINENMSQNISTQIQSQGKKPGTGINVYISASKSDQKLMSSSNSNTYSSDNKPINESINNSHNDGSNSNATIGILWTHRIKKSQSIFFSLNANFLQNSSENYLYSPTTFYDKNGNISRSDTVDQFKKSNNSSSFLNASINYTLPISKELFFTLTYGYNNSFNYTATNAFDKDALGNYSIASNTFSNTYSYNTVNQTTGTQLSYVHKKINSSLSFNLNPTTSNQNNKIDNTVLKRSYLNWRSFVNLFYSISPSKKIQMNYNSGTTQPTIDQLQPIKTNNDPLNIQSGNPNLKPSLNQSISLNWNSFKVIQEKSFSGSLNFSTTENAITSYYEILSDGRRNTYPINVNGNNKLSANINYGIRIPKSIFSISVGGNTALSKNVNFINGVKNNTENFNNTIRFSTTIKKKEQLIIFNATATHTTSSSSILTNRQINYWTYNFDSDSEINLPWSFKLNNQLGVSFREKIDAFDNNRSEIIWDLFVVRKLDKKNAFTAKFTANDIFNQRKGFSRNVSGDYITEQTYHIVTQYFTFSLTWNFSKKGTTGAPGMMGNMNGML